MDELQEIDLKPHTQLFLDGLVSTPDMRFVHQELEKCRRATGSNGRLLCIMGEAGVGKTFAAGEYAAKYPAVRTEEALEMPIVRVIMPPQASIRSMQIRLLAALEDPRPERGNKTTAGRRINALLRNCGVGMIIFDEAHRIQKQDRRAKQHIADVLQDFIDVDDVSVVLVGIRTTENILDTSRAGDGYSAQLRSRARPSVELLPLQVRDKDWRGLLQRYQSICHIPLPDLGEEIMVLRMHLATEGLHRHISNLLLNLHERSDGRRKTTLEHFAEAAENTQLGSSAGGNPFDMSASQVRRRVEVRDNA